MLTYRLLYRDQPHASLDDCSRFEAKWKRLEVRRCERLIQWIRIPEMDVIETIPRPYHLWNEAADKTIIYISKDGQRFKTDHMSDALGKYFDNPTVSSQIDKILCTYQIDPTDVTLLDELLGSRWRIPRLPPAWEERASLENVARTRMDTAIGENDCRPLGVVVTGIR
jgi:hypothetical protein